MTVLLLLQASYVLSLAQHFSDGLLSDDALYGANTVIIRARTLFLIFPLLRCSSKVVAASNMHAVVRNDINTVLRGIILLSDTGKTVARRHVGGGAGHGTDEGALRWLLPTSCPNLAVTPPCSRASALNRVDCRFCMLNVPVFQVKS